MSFDDRTREKYIKYISGIDASLLTSCAQNLLGDLKTPCRKPDMIRDICLWFSNDENVDCLIDSLDRNSRKVLTCLVIMGGHPLYEHFESVLDDMNPAAILATIQSLESKMVVFNSNGRYCFNPLIKQRVLSECFDATLLGETMTEFTAPAEFGPCLGREFLKALVNLMLSGIFPTREANRHYFYNGTAMGTCFPSIPGHLVASLIRHVSAFLIAEGFVSTRNYRFHVDKEKFQKFLELSMEEKILSFIQNEYDVNISAAASEVFSISRSTPMSEAFFKKVIHAVCTTFNCNDAQEMIYKMSLECGALCLKDGAVFANHEFFQPYKPVTEHRIDSDMVVSYMGTAPADDILYLCGDLVSCDTMVQYRITKDSYFRARNEGVKSEEIKNAFNSPEMSYLIPLYEDAYSRIKVYQGIVIRAGEQFTQVFENVPEISSNIVEKIAPGVYLMDSENVEQWSEVLSKALDIASIPATITTHRQSAAERFSVVSPLSISFKVGHVENDTAAAAARLRDDAKSKGILNDAVDQLIESGIIVAPSQLDRKFTYVAGMSAAGFTYSAKETIFKTALKKPGTMLKVELGEESMLATISAIEKDESGNAYAVLNAMPDGDQRRIKISSVFRVTAMRRCAR